MKKNIILPGILLMLFCLAGPARPEGKLFCYNSVDRLLSGNIWVYTTATDLERCLIQYPRQWGCVLLGTTLQEMKNGEIAGWGTVSNHRFFWVTPEYPFSSSLLETRKINLALLAVFNPEVNFRFQLPAGTSLNEGIIAGLKKLQITTAAIEVQGILKNTTYSIAYNLPRGGVNLKKIDQYLSSFTFDKPAYWHLAGLFSSDPELQKAISMSGPLQLHGLLMKSTGTDDKKSVQRGGHLAEALAEDVSVVVYPLNDSKIYQAGFMLTDGQLAAGKVSFKISNSSPLWIDHVLAEGTSGFQKIFSFRMEPFGPFSTQLVALDVPESVSREGLLVTVNGQREIFQPRYDQNQLVLGRPKNENRESLILYTRDDSVWQMTAAGRGNKKLEGIPEDSQKIFRNPVWSPDHRRLAYYAFDRWKTPVVSQLTPPVATIYLMDLLTRKIQAVFTPTEPQAVVDDLCFSADGQYLYFTLSQADVGENVVRINLENSAQNKVVPGAFQADLAGDGENMVYVAYNAGFKNVVVSTPDGRDSRIILSYGKFLDYARPVFSPDGKKIAVSAVPAGGDKPLWQLWLYDLNQETFEKLAANNSSEPFRVVWSPSGDKIFFSTENKIFDDDFKSDPRFLASGDL